MASPFSLDSVWKLTRPKGKWKHNLWPQWVGHNAPNQRKAGAIESQKILGWKGP